MNRMKGAVILSTFLIWGLVLSPAIAQESQLVVVATKATIGAAQKWVDYLTKEGIVVKSVEPAEFEAHKKAPFIVLMGGMDEAGGIKDLAVSAVGAQDAAKLNDPNGKMILKEEVWEPKQCVLIFTGANQEAAEKVRQENRDEWLDMIAEWFDLEIVKSKMNAY